MARVLELKLAISSMGLVSEFNLDDTRVGLLYGGRRGCAHVIVARPIITVLERGARDGVVGLESI